MNKSSHPKLFLGIDWGTHSSKWACSSGDGGQYLRGMPIHGSEILHENGELTFSPLEEKTAKNEDVLVRSLKGVLIHDPLGASFWDSPRADTGTSLGEVVVFSLCCLMGDAKRRIVEQTGIEGPFEIEVGFSFPNWVVERGRGPKTASKHFREAAAVALELFSRLPVENLPRPGRGFKIATWKEYVRDSRNRSPLVQDHDLTVENITQDCFRVGGGDMSYRFLMESGAAGLPYLRALRIEEVPSLPGLAKLLVVDVGAGSTDVGYMFRTRNIKTGNESFYFFHPASSFNVAGNELTEEIIKFYAARGQPLTYTRAEAMKIQNRKWTTLPFVEIWKKRICEHVREYVCGIPDHRWLPAPVSLNIVLTGGSGLVPGLGDEIKKSVIAALGTKEVPTATLQKVVLRDDHLPKLSLGDEAEYARRAVCLGAADRDKPGFRYMDKMDAPVKVTIQTPRGWV